MALVPEFPRLAPPRNTRQGFVEPGVFAEILPHLPLIGREIAAFAYASAWRQAEVLGLTWDVAARRAQEIRLPDTKNGRPRLLALTGELARVIERRWASRVWRTGWFGGCSTTGAAGPSPPPRSVTGGGRQPPQPGTRGFSFTTFGAPACAT